MYVPKPIVRLATFICIYRCGIECGVMSVVFLWSIQLRHQYKDNTILSTRLWWKLTDGVTGVGPMGSITLIHAVTPPTLYHTDCICVPIDSSPPVSGTVSAYMYDTCDKMMENLQICTDAKASISIYECFWKKLPSFLYRAECNLLMVPVRPCIWTNTSCWL